MTTKEKLTDDELALALGLAIFIVWLCFALSK